MLFMMAISLTTIKRFQTKENNHSLSILNQQFAMSLMMVAALAVIYITVLVVNAREIFKYDKIVTAAQVATITSYIITMPLITASILVILRTFGVFSVAPSLKKARNKDQAIHKISLRRSTLSSMQPASLNTESFKEGSQAEQTDPDVLVYNVVDVEEDYGVEIEEEEDDYQSQFTDENDMTNEEKLLQRNILKSLMTGHAYQRVRKSTK